MRIRKVLGFLAGALLSIPSARSGAADVWSPNCTPSIIQIFSGSSGEIVALCSQNGLWYHYHYDVPARTASDVDHVLRLLQASQLSGKLVTFRDLTQSGVNRDFDAMSMNR